MVKDVESLILSNIYLARKALYLFDDYSNLRKLELRSNSFPYPALEKILTLPSLIQLIICTAPLPSPRFAPIRSVRSFLTTLKLSDLDLSWVIRLQSCRLWEDDFQGNSLLCHLATPVQRSIHCLAKFYSGILTVKEATLQADWSLIFIAAHFPAFHYSVRNFITISDSSVCMQIHTPCCNCYVYAGFKRQIWSARQSAECELNQHRKCGGLLPRQSPSDTSTSVPVPGV